RMPLLRFAHFPARSARTSPFTSRLTSEVRIMPAPTPAAAPFTGVRCADIVSASVSWLWEPYLACGKLAVLDGDPGTGKSFVTIDLASRITNGFKMPGSQVAAKFGSVLLLNAEDDARDTIRPRVMAAAGDPEYIRVLA